MRPSDSSCMASRGRRGPARLGGHRAPGFGAAQDPHVLLALHQPTQPALGYLQPQHFPQLAPSAHTAAARAASSVSLLPQQLQERPAMLGARSRPCWDCKTASASHRIRELFRLEKPSLIIKFNYYPSTAKAITNPCPQVPHPHGF